MDIVLDMLKIWYNHLDELCSPWQANSIRNTLEYCILNVRQIRLGKRSEAAIDKIVSEELGFEVLNNEVYYKKNGEKTAKPRKVDHVWRIKEGIIYVVEQKLKDNHDNTKKDGQVSDFNAKVCAVRERYPDETVIGVFWYLDDTEKPSKRTLKGKLVEKCMVRYGEEIFNAVENGTVAFGKIVKWFEENRYEDLNINFDKDPDFYFKNLILAVDDNNKFLMKFMNHPKVRKYILPVISPEGNFSDMVKRYIGMID